MIVRDLEELEGDREVVTSNWTSRRLLLARDGLNFSLHDTVIEPGTQTVMWYRHHVEAVYCIEGEGEIEELPDGPAHSLRPGVVYVLDGHEKHVLRAKTRMRMVCVFDPPVTGREVHDADGAYPAADLAEG
jgi:L-ectoine synthase